MEKIEIQIARKFHKVYEKLAPEFGYTTRPETREFDENSSNGKLMIAVCKEVVLKELDRAREEVLLELLERKTNYKIERVDHGYKVTQEYVLVSDIEKELSKLKSKK
jgi:hypothetical protein